MAKYIDAERLKAEVKHLQSEWSGYTWEAVNQVLKIITSLQQEQPELPGKEIAEYYYHKGVYEGLSKGRADALKILDEFAKRKAEPVIVIKQQEQLEVDLEKEIEWEWVHHEKQEVDLIECAEMDKEEFVRFAHHFYKLGKNTK